MIKFLSILCLILFISNLITLLIFIAYLNSEKTEALKKAEKTEKSTADILSTTNDEQRRTDELLEKADGSCSDTKFGNSIALLHDISEKGKQRNKTD